MLRKIKEERRRLKKAKIEVMKNMTDVPEGKLRCAICRGSYQYYIGKRYINKKEKKIAIKLAEKEYSEKLLKKMLRYERALEVVEDFIENERLQEVYRMQHPARKAIVKPIYTPIEHIIEEFEQIKCEGKWFDEDNKTAYYTIKGERVRSKSEKIIADELYRHGIPYKYELPIELQARKKRIVVYPDFTVLNKRTGKRMILEHLGMMDKLSYFENTIQKLHTYEENDILVGRDLILLHETSTMPLDTKVLEKYIQEYLY